MNGQDIAKELIGRSKSIELNVLPLRILDDKTVVVGHDGNDPAIVQALRVHTQRLVQIEIMPLRAVQEGITTLFGPPAAKDSQSEIKEMWSEIAGRALTLRAANIFIEPTEKGGKVRLDLDGTCIVDRVLDASHYDRLSSWLCTGTRAIATLDPNVGQNGGFSWDVDGRHANFRLSTMPVHHPERASLIKLALRLQRNAEVLPSTKDLGMTPAQIEQFMKALRGAKCFIVIGAPPGQGKTTTMYSFIQLLDYLKQNYYFVEDPPEIYFEHVTQTYVNQTKDWTWIEATDQLLRHDPKFVFIGEARNYEVAQRIVNHSHSGLKFSTTVHAVDAISIFPRFRSMGVTPDTIAEAITLFVSQRLFQRLCATCRVPVALAPDLIEALTARKLALPSDGHVYTKGKGCDECLGRGSTTRQGVFEMIPTNIEIMEAIRSNNIVRFMNVARKGGYETIFERALLRVLDGTFDQDEILPFADMPVHSIPAHEQYLKELAAALASCPRTSAGHQEAA